MKFEEALTEVLKDSPENASVRKCDVAKAIELMSAPAPVAAPAAPAAPAVNPAA
jgi:hypothetical protein